MEDSESDVESLSFLFETKMSNWDDDEDDDDDDDILEDEVVDDDDSVDASPTVDENYQGAGKLDCKIDNDDTGCTKLQETGDFDCKADYVDTVRTKLQETGDYDWLKSFVIRELAAAGWKKNAMDMCKEYVRKKQRTVSVQELLNLISEPAKQAVPSSVKEEALKKIRMLYERGKDRPEITDI